MNDLLIRMTECDVRRVAWRGECLFHAWSPAQQPDAFAAIFEGLDKVIDSGELADELSRHDDFCELVAQVAVVRKLQRELDERTATDADHSVLNALRRSANPWIRREAGNLLMLIADERDQVAAHDGEMGNDVPTPGEECYFWGGDRGPDRAVVATYAGFDRHNQMHYFESPAGVRNWWSHARPVSMGKPEIAA